MSRFAKNYPDIAVRISDAIHKEYSHGHSSTTVYVYKDMCNGFPVATYWSKYDDHIGIEYDREAWTDRELIALYPAVRQKLIDGGYITNDFPRELTALHVSDNARVKTLIPKQEASHDR